MQPQEPWSGAANRSRCFPQHQPRGVLHHAMLARNQDFARGMANGLVIDLDARDAELGHDVAHPGEQSNVVRTVDAALAERAPKDE